MIVWSTALILGFAVLGAVDAFYIHLWKLRLHASAASWREHLWHTLRAILFVPILLTIFVAPSAGVVLWTGVVLLAVDQIVELLDVDSERTSRTELGGVGRFELMLHVVLLILRTGAIVFALASRPAEAWSLAAPIAIGVYPEWVVSVVHSLIPGAIVGALLHVGLSLKLCCAPEVSR